MNILVVGCGKVGSHLAPVLEALGHEVSVLAESENAAESLDTFNGIVSVGVPIDVDVLRSVGIESCDVVIAVTPDDNTNIMVAQMAKEIFNVPKVLARIYDPARKEVFSEQFHINSICPTNMTIDVLLNSIKPHGERQTITFGSTSVSFYKVRMEDKYAGLSSTAIKIPPGQFLFGIVRDGEIMQLTFGLPLPMHRGDCLVFAEIAD